MTALAALPSPEPEPNGRRSSRRDADPFALALFAVLRDRPLVDRKLVLRALKRHLDADERDLSETQHRALEAVRACQQDLGRVPSASAYRDWRTAQSSPHRWPSDTSVRIAFGRSWIGVRAALAGEALPDPRQLRLLAVGSRFSDDELVHALRLCHRHFNRTFAAHEYTTFARTYTQAGSMDDSERMPLSSSVFISRWGHWADALLAADIGGAPRVARRQYSDLEMLDALRRCAGDLGVSTVRVNRYIEYRRAIFTRSRPASDWQQLPPPSMYRKRFGGWRQALVAAGLLESRLGRGYHERDNSAVSNDQIARSVAAACEALGPAPTTTQYDRWRIAAGCDACPGRTRPPTSSTAVQRFGTWLDALAAAQAISRTGGADE